MRKLILTTVILIAVIASAHSQERRGGICDINVSVVPEFRKSPDLISQVEFDLGYTFSQRWSGTVDFAGNFLYYKNNGKDDYAKNGTLGITAAYAFWTWDNIGHIPQFEAYVGAGSSMGGKWNFLYAKAGLRMYFLNRGTASPYINVGMKYFNSYNNNYKNIAALDLTLGIRIFDR